MAKLISIFSLFLIFQLTHSKVLFWEGFEKKNFSDWRTSIQGGPGTIKITNQSRIGNAAAHFTCNGCHRSELVGAPHSEFKWGEEYWLGFSLLLLKRTSGYNNIHQHHSKPGDGNWSCAAGPNSFTILAPNNFNFMTSTLASNLNVTPPVSKANWGTQTAASAPLELNKWYDFVLHFRYAPDQSGFIEGWMNKKKIFSKTGPTVYNKDFCGKQRTPIQYLKIGLYLGGGSGEILYDEIRIGDANSSFDEIQSGDQKPDETPPTVPQNLRRFMADKTSITLLWNASEDPDSWVSHYRIYRDNKLIQDNVEKSIYQDTGLNSGTKYTYQISAVNLSGFESPKSQQLVTSTTGGTSGILPFFSQGQTRYFIAMPKQAKAGFAKIRLMNAAGRFLEERIIPVLEGGVSFAWPRSGSKPGVYFIETDFGGQKAVKRVINLR